MIYVNSRAIIYREKDNVTEIVIQTRNRSGERECIELPGGQVREYESLIEALKREVFEETGLVVTEVEGEGDRLDMRTANPVFGVECLRPYAVYQTMKGPVDSMGVYFLCKASGELLANGDDTKEPRWISVDEVEKLIKNEPLAISDVDIAGLMFFVKEYRKNQSL